MEPRTGHSTIGEERFEFDLQEMIELAMGKILPDPDEILMEYIEINYTGQGRLIPINKHKNAVGGANILKQLPQYKDRNSTLPEIEGNKVLVAKGVTRQELEWKDSDPYQTAGGYIKGVSEKGTEVDIYLEYNYSSGFKFTVRGDVSILTDHYNNNFYGNSTGNGTKTYQPGQRVERRTITGSSNSFVALSDKIKFTEVDIESITTFIRTTQ